MLSVLPSPGHVKVVLGSGWFMYCKQLKMGAGQGVGGRGGEAPFHHGKY